MSASENDIQGNRAASVEWRRPDNRFVPIRACEMIAALANDAERFGYDADEFTRVAAGLRDVIEQEADAFDRDLADFYAAFNPDRDTQPQQPVDELRTPAAYDQLFTRLSYLLEKANFERLSNLQIEEFVKAANAHGVRVKLHAEMIEHLEIWARGRGETTRNFRTFRRPIRGETRTLAVFRRIVVIGRLSDQPHVFIKVFKDIPEADLEALLPHAEVAMNWRDRILLMGGSAGTIGSTAIKVSKLAMNIAMISKLLWVILVGVVVLGWRTFMGYRRARSSRNSQRTQHLYYQNLSNNAGAIQSLIAMIAQEELKEAVLAYALCYGDGGKPKSPDELASVVQQYLAERFGVELDFDAPDAVESLRRLDLCAEPGSLRAVPCARAVEILTEHWRRRASEKYHESMAGSCAGGET